LSTSENGVLVAPEIEIAEIKARVSQICQPRQTRRQSLVVAENTGATEDGECVRVQVEPEQQVEGGPRRSSRTRTAVLYLN
jgi:hypothetical protein